MARDTPGRDAYAMRQAARKKTKTMFPGRVDTNDLKASVAHKIQTKQYVTPAERKALAKTGAFGLRGTVGKAVKLGLDVTGVSAIPKTVNDAYWSFTNPLDRLTGKGRASQQSMTVPIFGRPVWRAPTRNPDWEIIRNKKYDTVIGLQGRKPKLWGSHRYGTPRLAQTRRSLRSTERVPPAAQSEYYQAMLNQARRDVQEAIRVRREAGVDWTFSAVPRGTREPHASIEMQVGPSETYVDFLGTLKKTIEHEGDARNLIPYAGPFYDPLDVPPSVLSQLMLQALIPRRNLKAFVINDELEQFINRMQRKGMFERLGLPNIGFTQENPWESGSMR